MALWYRKLCDTARNHMSQYKLHLYQRMTRLWSKDNCDTTFVVSGDTVIWSLSLRSKSTILSYSRGAMRRARRNGKSFKFGLFVYSMRDNTVFKTPSEHLLSSFLWSPICPVRNLLASIPKITTFEMTAMHCVAVMMHLLPMGNSKFTTTRIDLHQSCMPNILQKPEMQQRMRT